MPWNGLCLGLLTKIEKVVLTLRENIFLLFPNLSSQSVLLWMYRIFIFGT